MHYAIYDMYYGIRLIANIYYAIPLIELIHSQITCDSSYHVYICIYVDIIHVYACILRANIYLIRVIAWKYLQSYA